MNLVSNARTRIYKSKIRPTIQGRFKSHEEEFQWVVNRLNLVDDIIEVDISLEYNGDDVVKETIKDLDGNVLCVTDTAYLPNGEVDSQIVTKDNVSIKKQYIYNDVGVITGIQQRKV